MSQTTVVVGSGSDEIDENDRIIRSIQGKREKFIGDLTPNGEFPKDKEDRAALIALMDGSTRTALTAKKIKSEEKRAVSQGQLVADLAETIRIMQARRSAVSREQRLLKMREVPDIKLELVEGHTDIGTKAVSTEAVANHSADIYKPVA